MFLFKIDVQGEIEDTNVRFTEAFNRQDAEAVSQFYTEDCTMMPTGSDVVQGKESQFVTYYLPARMPCLSIWPMIFRCLK